MPLPKGLRRLTPAGVRDDPRLRAVALGAGLIPPRTMHSEAEAATLVALVRGARRVVELGVYEGSSAVVLVRALDPGAELVLVDPYTDDTRWAALPQGAWANATATRLAVARARRRRGASVRWIRQRSQDVGRCWDGGPVDLAFIDGDHSYEGCRDDWESWRDHVSPGGFVAFHDARASRPGGSGAPGPTRVVDETFRTSSADGWMLSDEVDALVVVRKRASVSPADPR
jgi:predicted O-methyltransferase YrrM